MMDQNSTRHIGRIAIIGFGEVGPVFARALIASGRQVSVFDIKLQDDATRATIVDRARECGAQLAEDLSTALRNSQLVFSAVTASPNFERPRA
jgi:3-hydroxyisobutyrate dehydrogenase-like beta-hydroxyacid dehydrogenase